MADWPTITKEMTVGEVLARIREAFESGRVSLTTMTDIIEVVPTRSGYLQLLRSERDFDDARAEGYESGYEVGRMDGYDEGHGVGHDEGYHVGYEQGVTDSTPEGYA